jgi:hypothetical protein
MTNAGKWMGLDIGVVVLLLMLTHETDAVSPLFVFAIGVLLYVALVKIRDMVRNATSSRH